MNLRKLGGCKPKTAIYRFNNSYIKDSETECWVWQGKSRSGSSRMYGRIKVDGKNVAAHRFSWEMHNGTKIPEGCIVMHSCDNPSCVNPEHLSIGTHQDNMNDMISKDRQARGGRFSARNPARGSRNARAKFTERSAMQIFNDPRPQRIIAAEYGVSQTVIHNIKAKKTWRIIHE